MRPSSARTRGQPGNNSMGSSMDETTDFPAHAIAIVGLAGRFPGARNLDEFWTNMRDGIEVLETFSDADLDAAAVPAALREHPQYVRRGTALADADSFDAGFFGLSPREAQILDPQQRMFLECAWEALEYAGYAPDANEAAVGVYAGCGMNSYLLNQIHRDPALVAAAGGYQLMLGGDKDFLCTRVSYKLNLRGPSVSVQTACSTSLVAVQMACSALYRGECDMALAGGVSVPFPQRSGYLYEEGMILSPDGHCRPFDVDAHGTRPGAGCGIVVLKRLADAQADRDTIYAVIRGAAINNDGAGKAGYTAPSIEGQVEVIAMAQALAGVEPRSIGYVEAHGTGTALGDPIEVAALSQVFRASTADIGFCRLGSLKANVGHLDAAAGVAGLIKAVLAMRHREFPPLVNFTRANPQLALAQSPFMAESVARPWPEGAAPRRAGVSSFGIGGTNAHVVIEEAPPAIPTVMTRTAQLLVLSARSAAGLEQASSDLARHLGQHREQPLADIAWTLQVGRKGFPHRRMLVASDADEICKALAQPTRAPVLSSMHAGGERPVAFLFSGQGSQHVGMGSGLYRSERVFREAVDTCADLLQPHLGLDLRQLLHAGATSALGDTCFAQPALFVTEFALARLWEQWGVQPAAMLGHSIGEYVAAHLAGVLSLEDALAVVAARGRLMQSLPPGRMAGVPLGAAELQHWLDGGAVEIAAVNAPELCTVSGAAAAVDALLGRLGASGIDTHPLHTSHAFHSRMMEPALEAFAEVMARVRLSPPHRRYVSNLTGTWITDAQATSPAYYVRHLREPVLFAAGVQTLAADPSLCLLELGPGNVLATLGRMSLAGERAQRVLSTLDHRGERDDVECMLESAGRLWLAGVQIDWRGLHGEGAPRRISLPTYPFEKKRYFVDVVKAKAASDDGVPLAGEAPSGLQRLQSVGDWFYQPTWLRSTIATLVPQSGVWLVVSPPSALTDALCSKLAAGGARPVRVVPGLVPRQSAPDAFEIRLGHDEDVAGVAAVLAGTGQVFGAFLLFEAAAMGDRAAAEIYRAVVALAGGLGGDSAVRIVVVTNGGQSVLAELVAQPALAACLGPTLVLPTELPGLSVRWVDLAVDLANGAPSCDAAALLAEALAGDRETEVAYRGGRRWVRRYERLPLPPAALSLKPGSVVWITGGLGGMGLALGLDLARHCGARLLLTGRRGLPPRAQWDELLSEFAKGGDRRDAQIIDSILAIEAAGGEVMIAAADAADRQAMAAALDTAQRRWGAVDAVIHAAGVPGGGHLTALKASDEVDRVMAPKLGGLDVLSELLGQQPLDFFVLMGTINAVVGAPGVADYAAANAVLDAFVDAECCPPAWRRVLALDWGPWREVGMAANLELPESRRAAWRAQLQSAIGTSEGVEAFRRALASDARRLVVFPFNLAGMLAGEREQSNSVQPVTVATAESLDDSVEAPANSLAITDTSFENDAERGLAQIWLELLGVDRIGRDDDFFALGGHSLLATRVISRVDERFRVRLTLRDIFDAPTIAQLAKRVHDEADSRSMTAAGAAQDREELEF